MCFDYVAHRLTTGVGLLVDPYGFQACTRKYAVATGLSAVGVGLVCLGAPGVDQPKL